MLSILIVNWNTRDLLRKCLASIQKHPPSLPLEVLVVDNQSSDGSAEMVRSQFPAVILIEPGENTGYARGNNLAFEAATGDLLLTLNPDTEFVDDCLDCAVSGLERHPDAGSVAVRLVSPDGRTQRSVRGFPSFAGLLGDASGLGRISKGSLDSYRLRSFDYDLEQPAPQPMGTFLLFRRQALEAVGKAQAPFDESFPIFFNEVDLLYRLECAGRPCWYLPECRVLHHGGESTKQVRKSMIWESHKSLVRFLRKHRGTGWGAVQLPLLATMIYASAFVRAKGYDAGFRG